MKTKIIIGFILFCSYNLFSQTVSISTSAVTVGGALTVTWSGFSGLVNVYVAQGNNTTWKTANISGGSNSSQLIGTDATWGVRADYNIRVEQKSNTSIYRVSQNFSVNNPIVTLSTNSMTIGGGLTVNWSGYSSTVNVYIAQGSNNTWKTANISGGLSGSQWIGTDATWGVRSNYRIYTELKANTNIYSYSNYFSVTSLLPPTGVSVVYQSSNNQNYLKWDAVSGATSYKIYWSTVSGVSTSSLYQTTPTTDFGHNGVSAGYTYYYKVAAVNSAGQSSLSSEVSVSIPAILPDLVATKAYMASIGTPGTELVNPKVGDIVRFNCEFRLDKANINNNFKINCYLDNSASPYYSTTFNGAVSGSTYYPQTDKDWTVQSGSHNIRWVIDADKTISESDETNNEISKSWIVAQQFDLKTTAASIVDINGSSIYGLIGQTVYPKLSYSVIGQGITSSFDVRCTVDNNVIFTKSGISNSGGLDYSITSTAGFLVTSGVHTIKWTLDYNNSLSESDETNNDAVMGWTAQNVPTVPQNVQVVYQKENNWNLISFDKSDYAIGYRIYWNTNPNVTKQNSNPYIEVSELSTGHSNVQIGSCYYYRIASYNNSAESDLSLEVSACPTNPPALSLILPSQNQSYTDKTIQFQWSSVSNATSYELYVDNNSGLGSPEVSPLSIGDLKTSTSFTLPANWLTPGNPYYWKVFAKTPTGDVVSSLGTFTYSPAPNLNPQWVPFYRTFNPDVVDHFYCSADNHRAQAVEGNYRFEGVEGYVSLIPFEVMSPNTLVPIYRFYQTNDLIPKMSCHYYTTDNADRDQRIIEGWIYEGITGYGLSQPEEGLTSLYHTYLNVPNNRRDNFYTISEIQKNNSISMFGYAYVGSLCYISTTGDNSTMPWLSGMEVGSGINPQNGNLGHYTNNIFTIPEGKVGLNYSHLYNSLAVRLFKNTDPLGNGWSHSYNVSLLVNDVNIFVVWPDEVNIYNKSTLKSITPDVYDKIILVDGRYKITKKNQTIYTFEKLTSVSNTDNTYLLTSITDRHSNQIILGYNGQGYLKWVKSPANRYISFTYYPGSDVAKYGLIHYVKDSLALNRKVEYQYDDQRNLVQFIDAKGQGTIYKYEPINAFDHFLESVTYADGTIITNAYDPATKRMTGQNFISNQTQKHTTISIPVSGQVTVTDENNKSLTMTSDPKGNITELLTLKGNAKFKYTDTANPTKPTEITDGKGYVTTVIYNTMGDPLTINKPLNIKHQYEWNATNDLVKYINSRNFATSFTYTGNNLTAITTPRGTTNISYFDNGNIQTISDPLSQTITYSYDAYRNVKSVSDVLGNTTQYANDGASRTTRVTDANNQAPKYNYDANDLLLSTEDALNKLTYYTFDAGNRLKKVQDARGNSTSLNYNSFSGLLDQTTDQWGNPTKYAYFDNGLLQSVTNRNNQTISYAYDEINRLTSISGPSISRTLTYDKNDNVEKLSDSNGALQFTYDEINRILTQTDFYNNTVSYGYDLAGNIKNIDYPGGKSVVYEYEPDNLLKTVTDWDQRKTSYTYRNDGTIDRVTLPNGTYTKYSYDAAGRLTGMENKKSDGTVINSYSYTLDGLGNHVSVSSNEPLASPALEASSVTYNYDQANRILNAGSMTFSHDSNGNLVKQSNNGTVSDFSFDAENKLTGVSGSFNAAYLYDGLGFRRSATRNGVTTRYVLDASGGMENVLVETDASNQALYYYIHGNGLLYRIKATDNSAQYYHYDSRGSTIAITDQNQTITHQYAYDAFGKVTNQVEADFNPYRYVGKYGVMFENPDLYFMRARYYNPDIGRFLSEDPVWHNNLSNYAGSNPITNIDVQGSISQRSIDLINEGYYYQQKAYEEQDAMLARYIDVIKGIRDASFGLVVSMFTLNTKDIILNSGKIISFSVMGFDKNGKYDDYTKSLLFGIEGYSVITAFSGAGEAIKDTKKILFSQTPHVKNLSNYLKYLNKNNNAAKSYVNVAYYFYDHRP